MYKDVPVSAKERNAAQRAEKSSDEAALEALDKAEVQEAQMQAVRPPHNSANNNAPMSKAVRRSGGASGPRFVVPNGGAGVSSSQAGQPPSPVPQSGEPRRERNAARHERHLRQAMQNQNGGQTQAGGHLHVVIGAQSAQLPLPGEPRPPRLNREERRALRQAQRQQHSAGAPPRPPQE